MVSDALASPTALVILMTSLMPLEGASGQERGRDCCPHAQDARQDQADRFIIVERDQAFAIEPAGNLITDRALSSTRPLRLGATVRFDLRSSDTRRATTASMPREVAVPPCTQEASHAAFR